MSIGLVFMFSLGPAFFAILHSSIERGFSRTLSLVGGIFISDLIYFSLVIWGMSSIIEEPQVKWGLALGGGTVLMIYGVVSVFKKQIKVQAAGANAKKDMSPILLVAKGLIINGFNPFVVLIWLSIVGLASVKFGYDASERIYFFSGMLSTMLVVDVTKAYFADKLRNLLTDKLIRRINLVLGLVFIGFGLRLFLYIFENSYN